MIIDLDYIELSQRVHDTWLAQLGEFVNTLCRKYPDLSVIDIPDEQFRVLGNGAGEIFIRVRDTEIKMAVPAGEWKSRLHNLKR